VGAGNESREKESHVVVYVVGLHARTCGWLFFAARPVIRQQLQYGQHAVGTQG
jgi:hypothetical protein